MRIDGTQWPNASIIAQRTNYSNQNPVLFCNSSNEVYPDTFKLICETTLTFVRYAFFTEFPAGQTEATSRI